MNEYEITITDPITGDDLPLTVMVALRDPDPGIGFIGDYSIASVVDEFGFDRCDLLDTEEGREIDDIIVERMEEDGSWRS
jgi:hypothetical protein